MLFNSLEFVLFAACFFLLYGHTRRSPNWRYALITTSSFIFYGWWDWRYLSLLILSGMIDYVASLLIVAYPRFRRLFLIASLGSNLGILFLFKYLLWVLSLIEHWMGVAGHSVELASGVPQFFLVLPLGISFYTFQSMSYTIDVYRGTLQPTRNILLFFSFLSMFPQLVAGPIVRAADVLADLRNPSPVDARRMFFGLQCVASGLFKKVVIADSLAPYVEVAFGGSVEAGGCLYWWIAVCAFAAQIYCDFSGYSDIAIGLAAWMGLDFKPNFDHPYVASSLREFWGRWHISLSTWFRDYVYVPLGGSRCIPARMHVNLWVTMIVSGVWHGASWNFVVWGAVHAAFLSLERLLGIDRGEPRGLLRLVAATCFTLGAVMIGWVFFRSADMHQALAILQAMFSVGSLSLADAASLKQPLFFMGILFAWEFVEFARQKLKLELAILEQSALQSLRVATLLVMCLYFRGVGNEFIYFQF